MSNHRPASNLTFMSKVVERAVATSQLNEYLERNSLFPRYQRGHSTETALLRVWSDMLMAADDSKLTLLGLLDMSAAIDCVNHGILRNRLDKSVGIRGTPLSTAAAMAAAVSNLLGLRVV